MQIALILNPNAGSSLLARQNLSEGEFETTLLQTLQRLGIEPVVYHTTSEDMGEVTARQLAAEHAKIVMAVGGDGTIHSVARGLLGSESILGIIPTGTMNNLARSLGIPEQIEEACALIGNGKVRTIDVGSINQHFFIEVAGIGLEAALFPAAEEVKSGGILSTFRGVVNGLSTLIKFRPPHIKVAFNNQKPRIYRAIQITICNAPYYGARLNLAPGIVMNDGLLDVVIYTNFSKQEYIRHAISISQGQRTFTPKIVYRRFKSLYISTDEAVEIQADGTVIGTTPAEITIIPQALKVQVPEEPGPGLTAIDKKLEKRLMKERKTIYV